MEAVVSSLREKYNPVGIVIHGSRAIGKERAHSDWDIVMLFNADSTQKTGREEIMGEDVEWKAIRHDLPAESILDLFGTHLQFAKVLWETEGKGTALLKRIAEKYAEGPDLSDERKQRLERFLRHKLAGMKDDKDTPYMFLRHLAVFYQEAANYWYMLLHREYSKPMYLAFPEIENRDPEYHTFLVLLCSGASPEAKITAAESVIKRLFG